jgi:hypothetical protein
MMQGSKVAVRQGRGGFVQIGALAGLLALAGVITFVLSESRGVIDQTGALDHAMVGSTTADSGVRRLLSAINNADDNLESATGTTGDPLALETSGFSMELAIEGEGGKINPVTIARPILEGYVADASIPPEDRGKLLNVLAAVRETGDAAAAMDALHAHLARALTLEQIERDFSTLTTLTGVDPQFASVRVLRAVPDISDAQAAEIVRQRSSKPGTITVQSAYFATGRPLFTLVATVHWNERESFTRRVPIELTTSGRAVTLDGFR